METRGIPLPVGILRSSLYFSRIYTVPSGDSRHVRVTVISLTRQRLKFRAFSVPRTLYFAAFPTAPSPSQQRFPRAGFFLVSTGKPRASPRAVAALRRAQLTKFIISSQFILLAARDSNRNSYFIH